jgi:3-O-methylgallate 3,4-dioxygenase
MAKVVLGIGTSHGPMLVTSPDQWALRLPDDHRNMHPWRGKDWSFDDLVKARSGEGFEAKITPQAQADNLKRCRAAIDKLAEVFHDARIDVAVIVGNDQMEIFDDGLVPAFSVLWGDEIVNAPFTESRMAKLPPGIVESVPGYIPDGGATYPANGELGRRIIESVTADGFDVASMRRLPKNETPHAYGFVYRWIMRDDPAPSVPVVLNTFYPPNQPTLRRCEAFGKSILKAIEAWDSDARVALIASGGLTHFVIDEPTDHIILDALRDGDIAPLVALGEPIFQAGTSEVKNWIPVAGAMAELGLPMTLVDYVPVYRSTAGTGNAMAFVYWAAEGEPA